IHKTGTGTLTWDPTGGILKVGTLDVQSGTFSTSSAMEVGTLTLNERAYAFLYNKTAADAANKNIGRLIMGNYAYLVVYDTEDSSYQTRIDEIVVNGASVGVQDYMFNKNSNIGVGKLSLADGVSSANISFQASGGGSKTTVYELGDAQTEAGNFAGKITLSGRASHGAMILSGAEVAKNAEIEIGTGITNYYLALGINADDATIAGLSSADTHKDFTKLFSGAVSATTAFNTANITNAATRNLIINTAANTSYTFYGEVLQGVNLTKTGAGTQAFAGTVGSASVAVLGGTLDMTAAALTDSALADVTLGRGGQLSMGNLNLTTGKSLSVLGDDMSSTATLSGSLTLGGGNLSFTGSALDSTTAALTVSGGISLSASTQTITLTDVESLVEGNSYYLISGSFAEGITADHFSLAGLSGGYTGTLSMQNGGLWFTLTGVSVDPNAHIWGGTTENYTWDSTTFGVVDSGDLGTKPATFDDSAANHYVELSGSVQAANGVVFNNAEDYTVGFSNIHSSLSTTDLVLEGEGAV
ncbi:MAG: hypothetical protein II349_02360, partial [Akkermansia sp.]|nr:hypothetical protein [Akkermansia sp.]